MDASRERGYTRGTRTPNRVILPLHRCVRPVSIALALLGLLASSSPIDAHEIPSRVTVLAFVKPEAGHLRVLLRVQLESMRDVDFPLRGPGYLDIERSEPLLRQAARGWLPGAPSRCGGGDTTSPPPIG